MKRCPRCEETFSDDNFFCLSDGTPLPSFTVGEEETLVRPAPFVHQAMPRQAEKGVNPLIAYLSIGILALLVVAGAAIILFLLLKSNGSVVPSSKNNTANTISKSPEPTTQAKDTDAANRQKTNLDDRQAALEREKRQLADEREKLEAQKNKSAEPTPSVQQPPQATARLSFQRGSTQSTVSGVVGSERSYVLAARSGQYLSASVSSGDGCVTFTNGSTSTGFTTSGGDNRVTVVNKCSGQSSFSLTVSIR
jgi:hypothetical protein